MRKLELKIDELAVESFATAEGEGERGTVHANRTYYWAGTCNQTECGHQCPSGPMPCEGSAAFTDGMHACQCADDTGLCID